MLSIQKFQPLGFTKPRPNLHCVLRQEEADDKSGTADLTGKLFKNLQVILVRPENPINIGQSARAMKNFGVGKLVLVKSAPHRVPEAYTPGWKARKILNQAKRVTSLKLALKGVLAVGFTARAGKRRGEPRSFAKLVPEIVEAIAHQKVALVFGNEKNGLSNDELKECHWIATIPAEREYTSLNLSHAVAIVLATIYMQIPKAHSLFRKPERFQSKPEEYAVLMKDLSRILRKLNYRNTSQMPMLDKVTAGFDHYFRKAGLDRRELHLFQSLVSRIRNIIKC